MTNTPASGSPYPSTIYASYTVFVLFIAYTLGSIDRTILSLMVDPVRADLKLSDFEISLLQGLAFSILYVVAGIPIGRLTDRVNRRNLLAGGIAFWCASTAACGLSSNFIQLFIARMGVGVGEATLGPTSASIISDYFAPAKRALALSIYHLGYPVGGGLALIIGAAVLDAMSGMETVSLGFLGEYKPWQMAFFIVGVPGFAIAALMFTIREPKRLGMIEVQSSEDQHKVSFSELGRYINQRKRAYYSLYISVSLLGTLAYGTTMWYPVFFIRTYGLTASEAGYAYGLMVGIVGSLGLISGGVLSRYWAEKGYKDANIRVMILSVGAKMIPLALAPLMPTWELALLMLVPGTFFGQMAPGVNGAALQNITPNQMRGQVLVISGFFSTAIGLGLGGILIASITDFVFADDAALRYSLSIAVVIIAPIILGILFYAIRYYKAYVEEAEAWEASGLNTESRA